MTVGVPEWALIPQASEHTLTSPWTLRSEAQASGRTPKRHSGQVSVGGWAGEGTKETRCTLRSAGAILLVSVPATIITSACRGLARNTTPKRSMS